jgi:hypothetical protein
MAKSYWYFIWLQQSVQGKQLKKIQALESEINSLCQEKESWLLQREKNAEKKTKDQVQWCLFLSLETLYRKPTIISPGLT